MLEAPAPSLQMEGICKTYRRYVAANRDASLVAYPGEMHAVVGENGAGKSTLVGILYGMVRPDAGRIRVFGEEAEIASPSDAMRYGVGMVAQHSTLVPALTILDNLMLGHERARLGVLRRASEARRYSAVAEALRIEIPLHRRASEVSVAALQKTQIVGMLDIGARILVLDEPTSALAPHEAEGLFGVLGGLRSRGVTILLVTHRLRDVLEHCDRVTVLRSGQTIAERRVQDTSAAELSALMVGAAGTPLVHEERRWSSADAPDRSWWSGPVGLEQAGDSTADSHPAPRLPVLELEAVTSARRPGSVGLAGVTLHLNGGEILGVAGVDGSGQRELYRVATGIERPATGSVRLLGRDVTRVGLGGRMARGLSCVPEDRTREGLVAEMSLAENLLLGSHRDPRAGGGLWISPSVAHDHARRAIEEHGIVAAGPGAAAASLSGGNQQKLLLARALRRDPRVLVAMQPTRGLDVRSTNGVYTALRAAAQRGAGVLLFSLDLDEILTVSNRIAVMHNGAVVGVMQANEATREELGRLMTLGAETCAC